MVSVRRRYCAALVALRMRSENPDYISLCYDFSKSWSTGTKGKNSRIQ
jgi:hypothetical protein